MKQPTGQDDHTFPRGKFPLASYARLTDGNLHDLVDIIEDEFTRLNMRILADGPHPKRINMGPPSTVTLAAFGYGVEVQIRPEASDDFYGVCLPLSGRAWLTVEGQRMVMDHETGYVSSPGQEQSGRFSGDRTSLLTRVSRRAVDRAVCDYLGDEPAGPIRFDLALPLSRPEVRRWSRLVHLLAEEIDCGAVLNSPLAVRHFEQLLIHGLLSTQPHSLSDALHGRWHPASPHAVRRAVRFCEEHASEPISVAQIAAAARTSVRTLQEQFREHLGKSPMAYVRQIRLHHARADLLAIAHGQSLGTVTEVAHRWGFAHLSRFAAVYQKAYGEQPSQTLRER
ncbi:AraC family transcriptional regulator [Actinomadura sp. 9N407]|uniref:AraC family transcriptional regulator n=1 Tax=Actinomadura sp. 9N407 TaxID=3375154 RepID=UPI0037950807